MILYVNGGSHTAAAEAVNQYWYCRDDQKVSYLGKLPHPENIDASWGKLLSQILKAGLYNGAHADTNNIDIAVETIEWIKNNQTQNKLIIIQWCECIDQESEHEVIYQLHQELNDRQIPHVFINSTRAFNAVPKYDWGINYIGPYDQNLSYTNIIRSNGIDLAPNARHFGTDGHSFFARFMLQYIIDNKLI